MQHRFPTVAAAAFVAGLIACGSGGVRPSYKPFPRASVDTIKATPTAVIQEVAARITAEGLQVQWSSPAEGYFETQSYNVIARRSGNVSNADLENYIVVRFWADSISGTMSKVTGEATQIRTADPSVFGRDKEQVVPAGHPGTVMVQRILQGLHERFGK